MKDLSQQPVRAVPKIKKQNGCLEIPSAAVRGRINESDYKKALEYWGGCAVTGQLTVEMHHAKFRSSGGRGTWRNLVPLIQPLHRKCHTDREFADYWRQELEKRFGPWYWADRFDLYKAGLIPNATHEAFEKFMRKEEAKCKDG